jgi:hypothetical protein
MVDSVLLAFIYFEDESARRSAGKLLIPRRGETTFIRTLNCAKKGQVLFDDLIPAYQNCWDFEARTRIEFSDEQLTQGSWRARSSDA